MTDHQATVEGRVVKPAAGWRIEWVGADRRSGRLFDGERALLVVVEGASTDWVVTLRGRRIPVMVRSWRERMVAEAEVSAQAAIGPFEVRATLPGLVVAVAVAPGQEVGEGDALLTIEAMKMQNEIRAPRPGRVAGLAVEVGHTVRAGWVLLRLERG